MPEHGRRDDAAQAGSYLALQEPTPFYGALLRGLQRRSWSPNKIADMAVDVREVLLAGQLPYGWGSIDMSGRATFAANTENTSRILTGRTLLDVAVARARGQKRNGWLAPVDRAMGNRRECNGTKYRHRVEEDGGPVLDLPPAPGASLSLYVDGVVFARLFLKPPAQPDQPAAVQSPRKHRRDHPQMAHRLSRYRARKIPRTSPHKLLSRSVSLF